MFCVHRRPLKSYNPSLRSDRLGAQRLLAAVASIEIHSQKISL